MDKGNQPMREKGRPTLVSRFGGIIRKALPNKDGNRKKRRVKVHGHGGFNSGSKSRTRHHRFTVYAGGAFGGRTLAQRARKEPVMTQQPRRQ